MTEEKRHRIRYHLPESDSQATAGPLGTPSIHAPWELEGGAVTEIVTALAFDLTLLCPSIEACELRTTRLLAGPG
jgi:hypothetical protein